MKILITSSSSKGNSRTYTIEVLDGDRVVYKETAQGIKERDAVLWKLADLYDVLDIEVKDIKDEFKFTEIPTIPVLEEDEAEEFFDSHSEFVYERILQAVQEGIKSRRDSIRLFELNGTGVYITSNKADWKEGVQQALDYYISVEDYDKCVTARQLLADLL